MRRSTIPEQRLEQLFHFAHKHHLNGQPRHLNPLAVGAGDKYFGEPQFLRFLYALLNAAHWMYLARQSLSIPEKDIEKWLEKLSMNLL